MYTNALKFLIVLLNAMSIVVNGHQGRKFGCNEKDNVESECSLVSFNLF